MNVLKKIFSPAPARTNSAFYAFTVTCDRCGEQIEGRINLANDLSVDYEDGDHYIVRKVLMGSGHCFQRIEVELKFDSSRRLIEKTATGGKFIA